MAKVRVTIKETRVHVVDIGQIPLNALKDILVKNDGSLDGNWGLYDVPGSVETTTVDSIEVEPETKGGKA